MKRFFRWISSRRQERAQRNFDENIIPHFLHTSKYPILTNDQRNFLFRLIYLSKNESLQGTFWWCIQSEKSGEPPQYFITAILPGDGKGHFDRNHPLFKDKQWATVSQTCHMEILDKCDYLTISSFKEEIIDTNLKKTIWTKFSLNQKTFDFYRFNQHHLIRRIIEYFWDKAEKHLASFVFGILGAVLVQIILVLANLK
jgi:hypothetical protein